MDQVENDHAFENALEQIGSALRQGILLLDAKGQIVWLDDDTRRSLNGGLEQLAALVRETERASLACTLRPMELDIAGKRLRFCVIQEKDQSETSDVLASLEAVMSDTSWFTRTIVEKFQMLRSGRRSAAPSSDLDLLSEREREVLGLICEGRSDAEMSTVLDLSQNTVRNHIASLYRKIGVNRRSAAIIWARERGISGHQTMPARGRPRHRNGDGRSGTI